MTSIEGAPAAAGAPPVRPNPPDPNVRFGVIAAIVTYSMWGLFPLFFKLLDHVDPVGVVAHRVIFSLVFLCLVLALHRRFGEVIAALRDMRVLGVMAVTTTLLAFNWLIFVWGVSIGQVLQVSFGYFINPLVSVAIGMVLLGERQSPWQTAAIGIAVAAVVIQAIALGDVPWIALGLAILFGFYGYFRKTVRVGSAPGLFVETLLMLPPAVIYLMVSAMVFGRDYYSDAVTATALVVSGPLTALALIFFAYAARQLRLTTIGMFQYIAPSLHFLSAVFLFGETLDPVSLLSFVLIWLSLVVFSFDTWRRRGRGPRPA
ncbi:EamA family transporter RarD [Pelagibacterium montanilacus]|uniref:EamA family transporter RarD n=1 Tax=Pelagibacterium montanilacus TaxID=2185280 RepID=UPI000F8E8527|nr:EamA family transporter RarD [Pelagibacterium montanilacus]